MRAPPKSGRMRGERRIGAIDIGGTKIAVGIVSEDGQILARNECATLPTDGFVAAISRMDSILRALCREVGEVDGIGVGCPGPLDPFSGRMLNVGTLPGWNGAEFGRELQSRFGMPVAVENDADAATLAEFHWGRPGSCTSLIYITVSTGIGGGVVLERKLYRGAGGAHPELGHQVIDASGPLCYCGANGCWESLASGLAMTAWMREADPEMPEVSASVICERAALGEPLALKAVKRQGHYLGLGLANLVTLFAPERIALGGGVMKSGSLFLHEAKRVVAELCTQVPAANTLIDYATLGADVGLLGAARCWLQRFD
jgi:glucokinase